MFDDYRVKAEYEAAEAAAMERLRWLEEQLRQMEERRRAFEEWAAAREQLRVSLAEAVKPLAEALMAIGEATVKVVEGMAELWREWTGQEEERPVAGPGRAGRGRANCRCSVEVLPVRTPDKVVAGRTRWWARK